MELLRAYSHIAFPVLFAIGWVSIGYLTALIRWKWLEGSERIILRSAIHQTSLYIDEVDWLLDGQNFEDYHKRSVERAKSDFFSSNMFLGPCSTIIYITTSIWRSMMKRK